MGETERIETGSKRICMDRLDGLDVGRRVFDAFGSSSEVENVGISVEFFFVCGCSASFCACGDCFFLGCECDWVCEVVFTDSDCEFVEPQTFPLQNGEASVALEGETEMNVEGPPVKVETDRYREISGGANRVAPVTFECFLQDTASQRRLDAQSFVQVYSLAAIAVVLPVKLKLESERKEDENEGGKKRLHPRGKGKPSAGSDPRLPDAARCSGYAYGRAEVELRKAVWILCRSVVLPHEKRWKRRRAQPEWPSLGRDHLKNFEMPGVSQGSR